MCVQWIERSKLSAATSRSLQPADIVLDIGCGIRPQQMVIPNVHICCDPHGQYLEHLHHTSKLKEDRLYIFVQATWAEAVKLFLPQSVDTVFLLDVIEHVEKAEGKQLLHLTEPIARRQVVVFTPLGFVPQEHPDGKDAWGLNGGEWQRHRSGWSFEDFEDGWEIFASKDFHLTDNTGNQLAAPYGAFWAIKTLNRLKSNSARRKVHRFFDRAINRAADILVSTNALGTGIGKHIRKLR